MIVFKVETKASVRCCQDIYRLIVSIEHEDRPLTRLAWPRFHNVIEIVRRGRQSASLLSLDVSPAIVVEGEPSTITQSETRTNMYRLLA